MFFPCLHQIFTDFWYNVKVTYLKFTIRDVTMSAFDLSDPHTRLKYFNFFMYGSWSLLNPFLPVYFQHTGFTALQIGVLMSVGPMISLFANPFWGYWSDRLQKSSINTPYYVCRKYSNESNVFLFAIVYARLYTNASILLFSNCHKSNFKQSYITDDRKYRIQFWYVSNLGIARFCDHGARIQSIF